MVGVLHHRRGMHRGSLSRRPQDGAMKRKHYNLQTIAPGDRVFARYSTQGLQAGAPYQVMHVLHETVAGNVRIPCAVLSTWPQTTNRQYLVRAAPIHLMRAPVWAAMQP